MFFSLRPRNLWVFGLVSTLALCQGVRLSVAAPSAAPADYRPAFGWNGAKQGDFITAALQDSRGDIWVSTEDKGVSRFDAKTQKWSSFSTSDLGDDTAYALAEDGLGRIWAGTLNHGVAVWNGRGWKSFGPLEGPLGERIFAIAVNPSDGDVWIASNGGLSRYLSRSNAWQHFTRAQGLPADQIQALTFDSLGNLYAGTQCDGLLIGNGFENYATWRTISGPNSLPLVPSGEGLPSNQINDVLITDDDRLWVATTAGLAQSDDSGETWKFLRGEDWEAKIKGLAVKPASLPTTGNLGRELLGEDYVTNLAEDARGLLWTGYRLRGFQIRRPVTDRVLFEAKREKSGAFPYVSSLVPLRDGTFLVAFYGRGLVVGPPVPAFAPSAQEAKALAQRRGWKAPAVPRLLQNVAFPAPDKAPSIEALQALTKQIRGLQKPLEAGAGAFLGEDWRTQGDWVGRYGRRRAILCATTAPFDSMFAGEFPMPEAIPQIGIHYKNPDSIRRWIHWIKTDKRRTLYNPILGYRRQAEWDDHGEDYPMTFEGPDLWVSLEIPVGTWRVSSYFFNKDGHTGFNRARDYAMELRRETAPLPPWPTPKKGEEVTGKWLSENFIRYYDAREVLIKKAMQTPPLAQARVRDFWGGVHKQFVLQGPSTYWLKVAKNSSYNTIVSSVMFDEITPGKRWEDARGLAWMGGVYNPPDPDAPEPIDPFLLDKILDGSHQAPVAPSETQKQQAAVVAAARELWNASDAAMDKEGGAHWQWMARLMAYRAASANGAPEKLLENWRWKMPLWTNSDTVKWEQSRQKAYQFYTDLNPGLKNAKF